MADAAREGRVRVDGAERDAPGLGEHPGLELGHAGQVHRYREERPATREILAQLLARALGVSAGSRGGAVTAAPELQPEHAALGRLDPELLGQRVQVGPLRAESAEQPGRQAGRSLGREEFFEHRVDPIHDANPPALA